MGINIIMAKAKSSKTSLPIRKPNEVVTPNLLGDIRQVIEAAREQTARAVNSTLVSMYWRIGKRIREDVLQNERAEYGKEILQTLSAQLTEEYGRGFDRRNLHYMVRFAELFPNEKIVNALRSQLSWTHFRELLSIEDPLKREFYAEMCRVERWSTRNLQHKIGHMLFYHRRLRCLVAIDLKLGKFQAADKGQMELYLRYLEKHEMHTGEEAPIGLILCADKSEEHVELLRLEESNIRVSRYLTELPPKELLEQKLHQAISMAREQFAKLNEKNTP
jgi:hypothetical protein